MNSGELLPPRDVRDAGGWDTYWRNQMKFGAPEQSFMDSMASNRQLVGILARRGARTILCAGNGMSSEATALALHGFEVTALDISSAPAEAFVGALRDPTHRAHRIPGLAIQNDGSVTFGPAVPIDPELCPPMHRSADHPYRGGGSLSFVTGDFMDPAVCPGPFDVIIERRMLQLFPANEQTAALDSLVTRLAPRGVFVSHEHQGGWKPGKPRTHFASAWFGSRGFVLHSGAAAAESDAAPRLAMPFFSTG